MAYIYKGFTCNHNFKKYLNITSTLIESKSAKYVYIKPSFIPPGPPEMTENGLF